MSAMKKSVASGSFMSKMKSKVAALAAVSGNKNAVATLAAVSAAPFVPPTGFTRINISPTKSPTAAPTSLAPTLTKPTTAPTAGAGGTKSTLPITIVFLQTLVLTDDVWNYVFFIVITGPDGNLQIGQAGILIIAGLVGGSLVAFYYKNIMQSMLNCFEGNDGKIGNKLVVGENVVTDYISVYDSWLTGKINEKDKIGMSTDSTAINVTDDVTPHDGNVFSELGLSEFFKAVDAEADDAIMDEEEKASVPTKSTDLEAVDEYMLSEYFQAYEKWRDVETTSGGGAGENVLLDYYKTCDDWLKSATDEVTATFSKVCTEVASAVPAPRSKHMFY